MISQREKEKLKKNLEETQKKFKEDIERLQRTIAEAGRKAQNLVILTSATRQKIDERFDVKELGKKSKRPTIVLSPRAEKGLEIIKTVDEEAPSSKHALNRIENLFRDHLRKMSLDTLEKRIKGAELLVAKHPNEPKYRRNLQIMYEVLREKKKEVL